MYLHISLLHSLQAPESLSADRLWACPQRSCRKPFRTSLPRDYKIPGTPPDQWSVLIVPLPFQRVFQVLLSRPCRDSDKCWRSARNSQRLPLKAARTGNTRHRSLYMYPAIRYKIPYKPQGLRLPWRFLLFSPKAPLWIRPRVCRALHMNPSTVLISAKMYLSRNRVRLCNFRISPLYFPFLAV